jgi:hypothetical protein
VSEFSNTSLLKTHMGESEGNFYDREGDREMFFQRLSAIIALLTTISLIRQSPPLSAEDTVTIDGIQIS